jgi:dihydrodipicolinate synthase/N-acetylneuraminate lyase
MTTLKQRLSGGVAPAMATPLQADGYTVNTAVIPELVDFLIARGVSGLFVGGTTGEGILLDEAQRKSLHETAIGAVAGRVPVLLHVGANRQQTAVSLAEHAAAIAADAIAAVTPSFYPLPDTALAAYYHAVAAAAPETPLLLYDIPHLAGNGVSPGLLLQLAEEIPTLAGIKSSQRDAQEMRRLLHAAPERLLVLAGNERVALAMLALGADGLISGLSTAVPEPFVSLSRAFAANDREAARAAQETINQMLDRIPPGTRIGSIKSILTERGVAMGTAVPPRPMPAAAVWPALAPLLPSI